ncbi:MAG: hypothetical protein RL336_2086, partial [Pseudomonadota bacterium]
SIELQLDVSAQTFDRRQAAGVEVSPVVSVDSQFDEKSAELLVTIVPVSAELDLSSIGIDVAVSPSLEASGHLDLVDGVMTWRGVLAKAADYQVDARVSGSFVDGQAFSAALPSIQQTSPGLPVAVVKPVVKAPKKEDGLLGLSKKHTIYAAVALANLLLLALAIWAYRKFISKKDDAAPDVSASQDDVADVAVEAAVVQAPAEEEEVVEDVVSLDDIQAVDIQEDVPSTEERDAIDELLDDDELYEPLEGERVDELLSEAHADLEDEAAADADVDIEVDVEDQDVVEDADEDASEVVVPEVFDDAVSEDEADALWEAEAIEEAATEDALVPDEDVDDIPELDDIVAEDALETKAERSVFDALGDDLDDLSLTDSPFKPAEEKVKVTDFSALDDAELDAALDDILNSVGGIEDDLEDLKPIEDTDDVAVVAPEEALEDLMSSDLDASSGEALLSLDDEGDLELGDLDELLNDLDALDESKDDKK